MLSSAVEPTLRAKSHGSCGRTADVLFRWWTFAAYGRAYDGGTSIRWLGVIAGRSAGLEFFRRHYGLKVRLGHPGLRASFGFAS
jgi:hypothetical protein